jgi:hypothetical protein
MARNQKIEDQTETSKADEIDAIVDGALKSAMAVAGEGGDLVLFLASRFQKATNSVRRELRKQQNRRIRELAGQQNAG